jgi:hypothetical protein
MSTFGIDADIGQRREDALNRLVSRDSPARHLIAEGRNRAEGVVRCYMAGNRCTGFGYQKVKALIDTPAARAEARPRLYTSTPTHASSACAA